MANDRLQFDTYLILLQPYAEDIGPFMFDLADQLPPGDPITEVTVSSALDSVDTTALLIANERIRDSVIDVWLKYPGSEKVGIHKLTFKYTTESGAKDEANFNGVEVVE